MLLYTFVPENINDLIKIIRAYYSVSRVLIDCVTKLEFDFVSPG